MSLPEGVAARAAAADLLSRVLDGRVTLDEAMAQADAYDGLDGRDRAFAAAIARACLRHLGRIDRVLERFLARPLPDSAGLARAILRTGAGQLLFMGVAAYAVVSESVSVAALSPATRGFAKLINAVLRKVAGAAPEPDPALDLPPWLIQRWRAAYGRETGDAIAAGLAGEPPLDLSVKADAAGWAQRLGGTLCLGETVRLPVEAGPIASLAGYAEGAWWVQDAAAALPVRLLGPAAGLRVLDLCAAPGGKTLQLAAAGARVTALDISPKRLARLRENLARTGLTAEVRAEDALAFHPPEPFDAVLLDAPCTATGTLRRHPEAAWLRSPAQIASFVAAQGRLLAAAQRLLRPGGRLVYAVCSLEPEEGPEVVEAALAAGWRRVPILPEEVAGLAGALTPAGDLRTHPGHLSAAGGMDGFFVARLAHR